MQNNKKNRPFLGKYLLDSISVGMYNNPLMLFREYIQNSTDSIDQFRKDQKLKGTNPIEIDISGEDKSISIKDNGCGVKAAQAFEILHNIGNSSKNFTINKGFRGIGRLGGLGYCERLSFITKFKGESKYSKSVWNCAEFRKLINNNNKLSAYQLLKKTTEFSQEKYLGDHNHHFFQVQMQDVRSTRDVLMNVPLVKQYVAQVAPVPFNKDVFKYSDSIERKLSDEIPCYSTYDISVNGENILKPYNDEVFIYKDKTEKIKSIQFIELSYNEKILAFAWLADTELKGTIKPISCVEGLRLRSGNILVGDQKYFEPFFRETRFNNYLLGEIHILNSELRLNSRRDDFEDNIVKENLLCAFVKEIGIPYSEKIREASRKRSFDNIISNQNDLKQRAQRIFNHGYFSEFQQQQLLWELERMEKNKNSAANDLLKELTNLIQNSKHYFTKNHKHIPNNQKKTLKLVLDAIFEKSTDINKTEELANSIIRKF